jgi:hypothetical protein
MRYEKFFGEGCLRDRGAIFLKKISTIVYRQKMSGNNNALKKLQCEKKRSRRVSVPFALYRENRMKSRKTRQKTGFKPVLSL